MTLNVIHCNDLTVMMMRMYKEAAVLPALMKVYAIPYHDRGHINVMLVLQRCTDPLHILPDSSSEKYATSSDGACNSSSIEVEDDVDVIEEGFISMKEEADIGIKEEEIPEDIKFSGIKSEPDKVSSMCVYVSISRHILQVSRNISSFCDVSISGQLKQLICWD